MRQLFIRIRKKYFLFNSRLFTFILSVLSLCFIANSKVIQMTLILIVTSLTDLPRVQPYIGQFSSSGFREYLCIHMHLYVNISLMSSFLQSLLGKEQQSQSKNNVVSTQVTNRSYNNLQDDNKKISNVFFVYQIHMHMP